MWSQEITKSLCFIIWASVMPVHNNFIAVSSTSVWVFQRGAEYQTSWRCRDSRGRDHFKAKNIIYWWASLCSRLIKWHSRAVSPTKAGNRTGLLSLEMQSWHMWDGVIKGVCKHAGSGRWFISSALMWINGSMTRAYYKFRSLLFPDL